MATTDGKRPQGPQAQDQPTRQGELGERKGRRRAGRLADGSALELYRPIVGRLPFLESLPDGDTTLHDWRRRPDLPLPLIVHLLQGREPSLADVRGFDDFERAWASAKTSLAGDRATCEQLCKQLHLQHGVLGLSLSCRFSIDGYQPGFADEDPAEPPPEDKPGPAQVAYDLLYERIEQAIRGKVLEPVRSVGTVGAPLFVQYTCLRLADVVTWARAQGDIPIPAFLEHLAAPPVGDREASGRAGPLAIFPGPAPADHIHEATAAGPVCARCGSTRAARWLFAVGGEHICDSCEEEDVARARATNAPSNAVPMISRPMTVRTGDQARRGEPVPSENFRVVTWGDQIFTFSERQSLCLKVLWEARPSALTERTVREKAGSNEETLSKVFRVKKDRQRSPHPAWGTLIVTDRAGFYRIARADEPAGDPAGDPENRPGPGKAPAGTHAGPRKPAVRSVHADRTQASRKETSPAAGVARRRGKGR